jgi:hypothetical protein
MKAVGRILALQQTVEAVVYTADLAAAADAAAAEAAADEKLTANP